MNMVNLWIGIIKIVFPAEVQLLYFCCVALLYILNSIEQKPQPQSLSKGERKKTESAHAKKVNENERG